LIGKLLLLFTEIEMPSEEDEKTKSLKILEEVIGTKIKPEKKRKMFRLYSKLL
jgi:hypothetical protein